MKKLKMKDRWILVAGVLGGVVIGTSLFALIRVLRNRSESEEGDEDPQAQGKEGEQPVRHRRHGRHGDRRARAGAGEDRDTNGSNEGAASTQRH